MNRYVKVKGHSNWFLVMESGDSEPENFGENMKEQILRSEVCQLHNPNAKMDFTHRVILAAIHELDYEELANKYGTILIRPIGSYMMLKHNEIVEEKFDNHFPIDEFGDIVICENDQKAEYEWVNYLKNRFPGKKIVTINFFDLKSEEEVEKLFNNTEYITFSTTFTRYEWFKKVSKYYNPNKHKIIGYCHIKDNWKDALEINSDVEIVESI